MASGRIRRGARRGLAGLLLGWLAIVGASVALAPSAGAAPQVTKNINDLTPPYVSVDQGGTVTFVNQIQDKTVQVGGGGLLPTLVSVTAKTEVTLNLPSGSHVLAPNGGSRSETFSRDCLSCSITYTYRLVSNASLTSAVTDAALGLLPPLPAPTPFVVTSIPLPNLPGANVPSPPVVDVPVTVPGVSPLPTPAPAPTAPVPPVQPAQPGAPAQQPVGSGVPGAPYSYDVGGGGAAALAPVDSAAAAAFDPSRFAATSPAGSGAGSSGSGSGSGGGGLAGSYDGASVPVFGQLAGLDGTALDEESAATEDATAGSSTDRTLPLPALVAVIALAAVSAALVRTQQATRGR
ncbi:hypothetical protein [Blastococcus sp. SYSU D00820]